MSNGVVVTAGGFVASIINGFGFGIGLIIAVAIMARLFGLSL